MLEIDILPASTDAKGADSILIRFGSFNYDDLPCEQTIVLIDGGYSGTADAIIKRVRQTYKSDKIDCIICSHPDADHINGLIELLSKNELTIDHVCVNNPWDFAYDISRKIRDDRSTPNSVANRLDDSLDALDTFLQLCDKNLVGKIHTAFSGFDIYGVLKILGPSQDYYTSLVKQFPGMHEERTPGSTSAMVEVTYNPNKGHFLSDPVTSARNDSSTIILLDYQGFKVLFTGDAGVEAIQKALEFAESQQIDISKVNYMQLPHHGSIKNANRSMFLKIAPQSLFVSAPSNSDKHPSKLLLNYFATTEMKRTVYHVSDRGLVLSHKAPSRPNITTAKPVELFEKVHLPSEYTSTYRQ